MSRLWEIGPFDPLQTINYTQVHEKHHLRLQTANENEKKTRAREHAYILYTTTKKEKDDGLESGDGRAETEKKECWKKRKNRRV